MLQSAPSTASARSVRSRADWLDLAEVLVSGAVAFMSPDGANVVLPGVASKHGTASDGMEGFSRTLLLHGFRIAGDPVSANSRHTDRFLEGLHNGLRAGRHGHAWLPMADKGHAIAEAASIALALSVAPQHLWEPLDPDAKARIVAWLRAAVAAAPFDNNWRLFGPVSGAFLTSIGEEVPGLDGARERALAALRAWETVDGWVSDGAASTYDYYSSFALNYYPLMLAGVHGDAGFGERRDGARRFIATVPSLIDASGGPVYFGRSLTYRFGIMAAVSAGAVADALPGNPADARELTSDVVEHFVRAGAVDEDGTVRTGWFGAGSAPVQSYSGPAASYWLAKTFANVILPADHAYWSDAGERPAIPSTSVLANGLLTVALPTNRVVRLANHGSVSRTDVVVLDNPEDPQYSRLEYSTASAPAQSESARSGGFVIARGTALAAPGPIVHTGSGAGWAASKAPLRLPLGEARDGAAHEKRGKASVQLVGHDVLLASATVDDWLVHIVRVPPRFPWTGELRWGGSALPGQVEDSTATATSRPRATALVTGGGLTSILAGLHGFSSARCESVHAPPFAPTGQLPIAVARTRRGKRARWFAVATFLGSTASAPSADAAPSATLSGDDVLEIVGVRDRVRAVAKDTLTIERRP